MSQHTLKVGRSRAAGETQTHTGNRRRLGWAAPVRTTVGWSVGGYAVGYAVRQGSWFRWPGPSVLSLLPPDNATGNFTKVVQRVPVKIALDDGPLTAKLRSGLSAVVSIRTTPRGQS